MVRNIETITSHSEIDLINYHINVRCFEFSWRTVSFNREKDHSYSYMVLTHITDQLKLPLTGFGFYFI